MDTIEKQNKAAGDIVDLIASVIGNNREVHSATAIATAARLSGAFLFKSFNFKMSDAKPGSAILSNEANEEGPALINTIAGVLSQLGVTIDGIKMDTAEIQKSELEFLESITRTQSKANDIKETYGLNDKEMAIICAMATAFIIQQCQNDLNVEAGFKTAIYGLIEGSKTEPPNVPEQAPKKKPPFKFW